MCVSPPSPQLPVYRPSKPPTKEKQPPPFLPTFPIPVPHSSPVFCPKRNYEEHKLDSDSDELSLSPQLPYKRIVSITKTASVCKKALKVSFPEPPLPQEWLPQKVKAKEQDLYKFGATTPEILEALAKKKGTIQYRNGTYVGELQEIVPHGKGIWRSTAGDIYEGDWLNGEMHGQGSYVSAKGDFYNGEWKEGLKHGKGIIVFQNGDSYEGDWWHGHKHGIGTWKYGSCKAFYHGAWSKNEWHGHGIHHFSWGVKFEGNYQNNKKHGVFIITTPQGSECELKFEDDSPILGTDRILKLSFMPPNKINPSAQLSLDLFFAKPCP